MNPTKEDLCRWQQQGLSNRVIASMIGKSPATVGRLFAQYGIERQRLRIGIPEEAVEIFARMWEAGSGTKEIAEKTGYHTSTVYNHLKAAGMIPDRTRKAEESPDLELPEVFIMAEQRKPEIIEIWVEGRRYFDITDFVVPR